MLSLIDHGYNLVSNEILSSYRISNDNQTSRLEKSISIFNDFTIYLGDLINGNYEVQKRRYNQKVYEWALAVHAKYNASCMFGVADDFYSNMNHYFSSIYLLRKKLKSKLSSLLSKL